jgi:hypothetical protein
MKNNPFTFLYLGAMWGIAEATLGYVLHIAAVALPGLPGFVMFPVAFFFMRKAYQIDNETKSIMIISLIAAMIKLCDIFVPGNSAILVFNPVLSILMEGMSVFFVIGWHKSRSSEMGISAYFGMGVVWRSIFLIYMLVLARFNLPAGLVTNGMLVSLKFLLLESFINAILIVGYLKTERTQPAIPLRPSAAYGLLAVAIVLQIAL